MGALRGFGIWLFRTLLVLSLVAAIATAGMAQLTSQDFIQTSIEGVIDQQFDGSDGKLDEFYGELTAACNISPEKGISVPLEEGGITLNFDCVDVLAGKEKVLESAKAQVVKQAVDLTKTAVTCDGSECIEMLQQTTEPIEKLKIIMSTGFNDLLTSTSTMFFVLAIIFAVLVALLSYGIAGRILGVGWPVFVAGLPYLIILAIKSNIAGGLPTEALFAINEFTSSLENMYMKIFLIGIILIVIGLVLKYGFKIDKEKKSEKKDKKKK